MEELIQQFYSFLKVSHKGDVLRIHIKETNKSYELTYEEVVDLLFHNKIPERLKKEVEPPH